MTTEEKQATIDALQAILAARNKNSIGGNAGGSFDIDIDPDLDMPESDTDSQDDEDDDIDINDPDDVLSQLRQRQQNKGGQGQNGAKGSSEENQSDDAQQGDEAEDSEKDGQTNANDGANAQNKNDKDPANDENGASSQAGEMTDDNNVSQSASGQGTDDEEAARRDAWNKTIDEYDNDSVSRRDLENAIKKADDAIAKGDEDAALEATKEALEALLAAMTRNLVLDQKDIDEMKRKGYKLPRNVEAKAEDDSDGEDEEERSERLRKIEKSFEDDAVESDLQDIRTDTTLRKNAAIQAKAGEARKLAQKGQLLDFSDFSFDLFRTIKSQVSPARAKDSTWKRPNPTYAGTNLLSPGQDYPDKKNIPTIYVYFDQSPSWGMDDIKAGIDAITSLASFERKGKIKIKLLYFANKVYNSPQEARWESGTRAFPEIVNDVRNARATNVIIMSDADLDYQTDWDKIPQTQVPGCVWYLWRNGSRSNNPPKFLSGRGGTFEYKL